MHQHLSGENFSDASRAVWPRRCLLQAATQCNRQCLSAVWLRCGRTSSSFHGEQAKQVKYFRTTMQDLFGPKPIPSSLYEVDGDTRFQRLLGAYGMYIDFRQIVNTLPVDSIMSEAYAYINPQIDDWNIETEFSGNDNHFPAAGKIHFVTHMPKFVMHRGRELTEVR